MTPGQYVWIQIAAAVVVLSFGVAALIVAIHFIVKFW